MTSSTHKPADTPNPMVEPVVYDERQAAKYIGSTPNMLRLSRHTGELGKGLPAPPFVRYGRAIRYFKSDLDAWLEDLPRFFNTAQKMRT